MKSETDDSEALKQINSTSLSWNLKDQKANFDKKFCYSIFIEPLNDIKSLVKF